MGTQDLSIYALQFSNCNGPRVPWVAMPLVIEQLAKVALAFRVDFTA
jgi:hypothetical protein